MFPCEEGHAQERSLLSSVLETVKKDDLWCAGRHFCTLNILFKIQGKTAFFVIRQHARMPFTPLSEKVFVGKPDKAQVYEHSIRLSFEGKEMEARRIIVALKKYTRNGDNELCVLTNIKEGADALTIAHIHSQFWTIETAFQKLEKHLNSEINSLGYPKAALFGVCMA